MTSSTHTPGPWQIGEGNEIEAKVDPENSDSYWAPICTIDDGWSPPLIEANACLIAAAPELLANAAACLEIWDNLYGHECDEKGDMQEIAAFETLRAIIAKAEGAQ